MSLKESSDELNPTVVVPADAIPAPKRTRSGLDYVALAISTWGVGYLPLMPGTFGSLVGIGIFLLLGSLLFQLVAVVVITWTGIWAASRTERILRLKDPGKVVVDEVAGQMIALLPLSLFAPSPARTGVIVSFVLFRLFDIFKPYPARRFERLRSGLGIMADDLVAGVYGAIGTTLLMFSWR
ncbi:MAG TPA: phosphatidylglycerophosphatase A [Pyrinomonadaceae bacterium]|nr:phosphatidylglycerophosphatase A [Pyrinomonadaceae bacterium]